MALLYTGGGMIARDYYYCIFFQLLNEGSKEAPVNVLNIFLFAFCVAVMTKFVGTFDVNIDCIDTIKTFCGNLCLFFIIIDFASFKHLHVEDFGYTNLDWH